MFSMQPGQSTPRQRRPKAGKAALDAMYRGAPRVGRPLLFLDIDDVLGIGRPYGGYDVFQPSSERPADLWQCLWHPPAVEALRTVLTEYRPSVVVTSSWLRLCDRDGFVQLFQRTGLPEVAGAFHDAWEAPQDLGKTRLQAIEKWLHARYTGEPLAVLDDALSGTGLRGSRLQRAGCVVLCEVGVGLHAGHLDAIRGALHPNPTTRPSVAHV